MLRPQELGPEIRKVFAASPGIEPIAVRPPFLKGFLFFQVFSVDDL